FFFSSRRRHTRFSRDWSSDVCSSDLLAKTSKGFAPSITKIMQEPLFIHETTHVLKLLESLKKRHNDIAVIVDEFGGTQGVVTHKIGRAACREREEIEERAGAL